MRFYCILVYALEKIKQIAHNFNKHFFDFKPQQNIFNKQSNPIA